jgi:hypothetical protein
MAVQKKSANLERDIARALSKRGYKKSAPKALLVTGLAIACLQPEAVMALGLSEIEVTSELGQPFVSTTTARIGPGETLSSACLTSVATPEGSLGAPQDLKISAPDTSTPGIYPVRITSRTPLYEPMYEIKIKMKCGSSMTLIRDYVVMLNLPMTSPQTQTTAQPQTTTLALQASAPQRRAAEAQQLPEQLSEQLPEQLPEQLSGQLPEQTIFTTGTTENGVTDLRPYTERYPTPDTPIEAANEYRVQPGDMLSTIAQRVTDRPVNSTFAVADQLFQLNPDAFIANDPNRLKLGAVLSIPAASELTADRRQLLGRKESEPSVTSELVTDSADINIAATLEEVSAPETNTAAPLIAEQPVSTQEPVVTATADANPAQPVLAEKSAPVAATAVTAPEANTAAPLIAEQPVPAQEPAVTATAEANPAQPVLAEKSAPVAATAVTAPASEAAASPEIIVDIREPLEPVYDIESTELEAATRQALTPAETTAQAAPQNVVADTESGGMSIFTLLTVILGSLAGLIIALLLWRKRMNAEPTAASAKVRHLLNVISGGRWSATAETVSEAPEEQSGNFTSPRLDDQSLGDVESEPAPIQEAAEDVAEDSFANPADNEDFTATDLSDTDVAADNIAAGLEPLDTLINSAEADIEASESSIPDVAIAADEEIDFDLSDANIDSSSLSASGIVDFDLNDAVADLPDLPEVELPEVGNIESSTPEAPADHGMEENTELTNTMHKLFSEEAGALLNDSLTDPLGTSETIEEGLDKDVAMTQDQPLIDAAADLDGLLDDDNVDLQSLSQQADAEPEEDELAQTLHNALGLLEQDYEDEFSASQILQMEDIEKALKEHEPEHEPLADAEQEEE